MYIDHKILVGKNGDKELFIYPGMANRHGLITGATGSGKTITLKVMAESFSAAGVPVFLSDIKGDLAGTALPGEITDKIKERLTKINIDPDTFHAKNFPVVFWDVFGKDGHPVRATVESIGPVVLSNMLGLSEAQEGVLTIAFKVCKDLNLPLIDLKDLRSILNKLGEERKDYTIEYGNVAPQTVGAIQRSILQLQEQGGDTFFGEPALDIHDFLETNTTGQGNINILHCVELFKSPKLYASFMLWLLNTLSNTLPEVGDLDKPKIVFFFDEAHLLFNDLPKYMLTSVTQVVKLIRSKGIGLFFISQTPNDIPNEILAQLSNKTQHTLRAYTPADQKIVKAVANSFRVNPDLDTEKAILELGTGEAVISYANEKGEPNMVEKATILPPQSMMGAIDEGTRLMIMSRSPFKGKYDVAVDNESAYEVISKEREEKQKKEEAEKAKKEKEKADALKAKEEEKKKKEAEKAKKEKERKLKNSLPGRMARTATNTVTRKATNKIVDKIWKSIFK